MFLTQHGNEYAERDCGKEANDGYQAALTNGTFIITDAEEQEVKMKLEKYEKGLIKN